jgi:hypothetical protein
MRRQKTKVLDSKKYLNEQEIQLPKNSIFDKGRVGCGGTTIALESKEPYIICVPFVSLIENKISQYDNLYGFYSGHNLKRDLQEYLDNTDVPRILVTYDSLAKLMKWINPKDYKILIDELHILFTEYSYRREAAQTVLQNYMKFKEFCFMTATVLEDEFMLDELKDIPIVEAQWNNLSEVRVQSIRCKGKVKDSVANIINDFIQNKYDENVYFFVNSVSYIKDLIRICGLTSNNTRAIYSKNNTTDLGIERGITLDTPKKINFVTSTAFEGSDIYDENGLTFIISDSAETQTLVDISTKFQ